MRIANCSLNSEKNSMNLCVVLFIVHYLAYIFTKLSFSPFLAKLDLW